MSAHTYSQGRPRYVGLVRRTVETVYSRQIYPSLRPRQSALPRTSRSRTIHEDTSQVCAMETEETPPIPDEYGQLSVCFQELQTIPSDVFSYPHSILRLNLSHNNLTELPREIGFLILLRDLDVSNNRLQRVDPSIAACIRLRRLSLSNNELAHVPSEVSSCSMLEEIDLTHNRLQEIPKSLATLPALSELRLDNNDLARLPTSLSLMPTLSVLTCTSNSSALDSMIPAHIQSNSLMIKWCLGIVRGYNEKEEAAKTICQELQGQAASAANEQQRLLEEVARVKNDVAVLQAERPAQYLERKRRCLAAKSRWSRRFNTVGDVLCCEPLRPKRSARVSIAAVDNGDEGGSSGGSKG